MCFHCMLCYLVFGLLIMCLGFIPTDGAIRKSIRSRQYPLQMTGADVAMIVHVLIGELFGAQLAGTL